MEDRPALAVLDGWFHDIPPPRGPATAEPFAAEPDVTSSSSQSTLRVVAGMPSTRASQGVWHWLTRRSLDWAGAARLVRLGSYTLARSQLGRTIDEEDRLPGRAAPTTRSCTACPAQRHRRKEVERCCAGPEPILVFAPSAFALVAFLVPVIVLWKVYKRGGAEDVIEVTKALAALRP